MPNVEQFLEALSRDAALPWPLLAEGEGRYLAENWDTGDATRNVLLFPDAPRAPRTDVLAHVRGGLVTDSSLRPRVSAIVGPGATVRGVAERVRPVFTAAATAANAAPTVDELAQAILVYSEHYLPVPGMRAFADGLRIPLPIEIDQANGDWVVNGNHVRLWLRAFQAAWRPLLDRRPARLTQPDPVALPQEVQQFLQGQRTALGRGIHLLARVLANPFKEVFFFFEAVRQLGASALEVALLFLDNAVNHQVHLLASLTAGQAMLRGLERLLQASVLSPPAGFTAAQQASRTRGLNMLAAALRPGGQTAPRRELPETAQQLANRPGTVSGGPLARAEDPPAGRHRMVLGRDVLAGAVNSFPSGGQTFVGPAYRGRIPPGPFIAAHGNLINPTGDTRLAARLRIVQAIAMNEALLDGVRMQDRAILSVGMQQWSAHSDLELPALLALYKVMDEDEFDLFFGLYDLDVRADGVDAHGNPRFMLQRVQPDGTRVDLVTPGTARHDFFGGTTTGVTTTFRTVWAARSREPAIASLRFRATEVVQAAARFDRIARQVGSITVGGAPVPLTTLITSQLGVALIVDAHINLPNHVPPDLQAAANAAGAQPNPDARDQAITQQYASIRHTHNTAQRNAHINAQGLDPGHGSFAGW